MFREGWLFYLLTVLVAVSETVVLLVLFYYYYVSIAGWRKHPEEKDYVPEKRFAFITAAPMMRQWLLYHLESLKQINYPGPLTSMLLLTTALTTRQPSPARKAPGFMSGSPISGAKAMPWSGCSTGCLRWRMSALTMRCASSMPIMWCLPISCWR